MTTPETHDKIATVVIAFLVIVTVTSGFAEWHWMISVAGLILVALELFTRIISDAIFMVYSIKYYIAKWKGLVLYLDYDEITICMNSTLREYDHLITGRYFTTRRPGLMLVLPLADSYADMAIIFKNKENKAEFILSTM